MSLNPLEQSQMEVSAIVARNANAFRLAAGLAVSESAKSAGITTERLCAIESGKIAVDGAILLKLAALYGVSLDDFFEGASIETHHQAEAKANFEAKTAIKGMMKSLLRDVRGKGPVQDIR